MAKGPTSTRRAPAPPPSANPRRRRRFIGVGLAAALVASAAGFAYLTRGPSDVTVDQAVKDYRAHETTTTGATAVAPAAKAAPAKTSVARTQPDASRARLPTTAAGAPRSGGALAYPASGVYVFATRGYEETNALTGQRHDYPKETSMTVRRGDCGWISHWQPLNERWEESALCEHATGTEMARYSMYHEFFRKGQREDFACPGGYVQKSDEKPGQRWTFTCKSSQSTAVSRNTVVAIDTIVVGGRSVPAVHIRYEITASGADKGTLTQDRWLSLGSRRIIVRMIQKANLTTQSPFGPVGYKESFRLDLKSLDPRT